MIDINHITSVPPNVGIAAVLYMAGAVVELDMAGTVIEPQYSWHSCRAVAGAVTELNMAGTITKLQYSWHSCWAVAGAVTELNMAGTIIEPDNLKRAILWEERLSLISKLENILEIVFLEVHRIPWPWQLFILHVLKSVCGSACSWEHFEWPVPVWSQLAFVRVFVLGECLLQDQLSNWESPLFDLLIVAPSQLLLIGS